MKRSMLLAAIVMSALLLMPFSAQAAPARGALLQNLPVTGTLEDGGTFAGTVTITEVGYDTATGLWVSGILTGVANPVEGEATAIEQSFSQVSATLNETSGALGAQQLQTMQTRRCQILFLDIGPIFLDVLGLQVDLSEIILDITAVGGAGNLLGNLLCAVAGLLDPGGFLNNLITGLNRLLAILDQINRLLG
ncbi:MAG TPA: hypothetical protein PKD53_09970 [Chloroflexaceae bacterium]|nr:hypothetical protein [Chloroflexaceae bacterium]